MSVEHLSKSFQEAALNRRWIIRSAVKTVINRASITLHSYKLPLLCRRYCCSCSNSSGNDYRYACLIAGCHLRLIASTVIVVIDRHAWGWGGGGGVRCISRGLLVSFYLLSPDASPMCNIPKPARWFTNIHFATPIRISSPRNRRFWSS